LCFCIVILSRPLFVFSSLDLYCIVYSTIYCFCLSLCYLRHSLAVDATATQTRIRCSYAEVSATHILPCHCNMVAKYPCLKRQSIFPCCDVRYDFQIKTMLVGCYLQFVVGGLMSYIRYLYLITYSGVQYIFCCVFVLLFFVLCTLCCQFLWIVP
jgi:hypothetical protein